MDPQLSVVFDKTQFAEFVHEKAHTRSGRADHFRQEVRFGPRPFENSNARRARRNILKKLRIMTTDNAADIRLDAMLENCIFYISPMYEFSHSLAHNPTASLAVACQLPPAADIGYGQPSARGALHALQPNRRVWVAYCNGDERRSNA